MKLFYKSDAFEIIGVVSTYMEDDPEGENWCVGIVWKEGETR